MITLEKDSNLLKLPEQVYGTIKKVGILNNEPILYGDYNLLKNGDLYYILGAKQVYKYVKTVRSNDLDPLDPDEPVGPDNPKKSGAKGDGQDPEDQSTYHIYLYFDTIDTPSTDGLSIPEDERGLIHRAGYLFNEIIYSGDPNLIDNGQLFYHYTLPYISVTSVEEGVITLSTKSIDEDGNITTTYTDYRVSPEPEIALVISDINKDTYYYIRNLDEDTTVDDVVYYAWKDANDDNPDIYFTESETPSTENLLYKLVGKDMQALVGYSITNIILAKDIPTE